MLKTCGGRALGHESGRPAFGRIAWAAAVAVTGCLAAAPARANASYAFGGELVGGFEITSPVQLGTLQSSQTSNLASFDGYGSQSTSAPLDALQAFVGPATPTPQNDFAPYGTAPGSYARADSLVSNVSSATVAEDNGVNTAPGKATASGSMTFQVDAIANRAILIEFGVSALLRAAVQSAGGNAVVDGGASMSTVISVFQGSTLLMRWTPDGDTAADPGSALTVLSGSVFGVVDPTTLNTYVLCQLQGAPACNRQYLAQGTFVIGYTPTVGGVLTVDFSAETSTQIVPEPAPLAVLAAATATLALARRRTVTR